MTVTAPQKASFFSAYNWPVLAFLISAALLGGAYAFQYIGGYNPCIMCYWQRHAHKAVMGVSVLALMQRRFYPHIRLERIFLWAIAFAFLVSFGYGFGHVGVEQGWWEGPKACLVLPQTDFNPADLLGSLSEPMAGPACADVVWSFLGLSMAGWNALVSASAALISIWIAIKMPSRT